jgi:cell division protein FtsZ
MGTGVGRGERRALEAMQQAINSPLLEEATIDGATGLLINITAPKEISLQEINEAVSLVQESADPEAEIIFGSLINDDPECDLVKITIIATGFAPKDGMMKRSSLSSSLQVRSSVPRQDEMNAVMTARSRVASSGMDKSLVVRPTPPMMEQAMIPSTPAVDEDRWDIPTFLRKQVNE